MRFQLLRKRIESRLALFGGGNQVARYDLQAFVLFAAQFESHHDEEEISDQQHADAQPNFAGN